LEDSAGYSIDIGYLLRIQFAEIVLAAHGHWFNWNERKVYQKAGGFLKKMENI
jgi:hypothetical protein